MSKKILHICCCVDKRQMCSKMEAILHKCSIVHVLGREAPPQNPPCLERKGEKNMKQFTDKEQRQYLNGTSELTVLQADCSTKKEFEYRSLTWLEREFQRGKFSPSVYYSLCKFRASILQFVTWAK